LDGLDLSFQLAEKFTSSSVFEKQKWRIIAERERKESNVPAILRHVFHSKSSSACKNGTLLDQSIDELVRD